MRIMQEATKTARNPLPLTTVPTDGDRGVHQRISIRHPPRRAVSRYAIAEDGTLTLDDATAAFSVDGRPGLRDEGRSVDGRHLYAIDADTGTIFGWEVGENGMLSPVGSWGGLPAGVAGLASRQGTRVPAGNSRQTTLRPVAVRGRPPREVRGAAG